MMWKKYALLALVTIPLMVAGTSIGLAQESLKVTGS